MNKKNIAPAMLGAVIAINNSNTASLASNELIPINSRQSSNDKEIRNNKNITKNVFSATSTVSNVDQFNVSAQAPNFSSGDSAPFCVRRDAKSL